MTKLSDPASPDVASAAHPASQGDGAPPWAPAAALSGAAYSAVELASGDDRVFLLDQRDLPQRERYLTFTDAPSVAEAIRVMIVRGAPAIGIAAAYGMALAAHAARREDPAGYVAALRAAADLLGSARPTAVNLVWAVRRVLTAAEQHADEPGDRRAAHVAELARGIHREDVAACRQIGRIGAVQLPESGSVLTHCNAGALATGGYGTALGVVRAAVETGKTVNVVYACETRPYYQGARLTAWELQRDGFRVEVISDSMTGWIMSKGQIRAVIVGADRIARNGDVANKIGTYGLACLARHHGIPFYVAAPWSTVDIITPDGGAIPIEERSRDEMALVGGRNIVPDGVVVHHPAFDVTPAELVTAFFTERGKIAPRDLGRMIAPTSATSG